MRRKPDVRYVDMAMYVDSHVHEPNHDVKKIYDYLTMLAYMLAVKRRFFNYEWYYDRFAEYLARITYMRIIKADKPQYITRKVNGETVKVELHEGDKGWLSPIKSCLNYMKQVLYVKKCQFVGEEFDYVTDKNNIGEDDAFYAYAKNNVLESNNDLLICNISLYLSTISRIIKSEIDLGVYGKDKILCWKLYTSCLLSLVRNLTLNRKNSDKARRMIEHKTFDEDVMSDMMKEESLNAPITYDLDDSYLDYISYILQRVKYRMISDIGELSNEYSMTDEMVEDILMLGLSSEGDDD